MDFGGGWATVVGVARDGKYGSIAEAPRNVMYLPIAQAYRPTPTLIVATTVDPASVLPDIRRVLRDLNPNLPLFEVRTLEEHLAASVFLSRLASTLLGAFGGLALVLAAIGLYGVVAYSVSMRTREIGVRMALGAGRAAIRREVLGQGLRLAVVGLAGGLGLTVLAAPLLASQLVGVRPTDALVLATTSAALLVVAGAATWMPAWRASRIDPIRALRRD
jgi:ABC-type antimicrobial peptide transport system permease subunit